MIFSESINEYENRTAYQYQKPTITTIINKEFQDNIELTLADQIPFATTMKKNYNDVTATINYKVMKNLTKNDCNNKYISMMPGVTTFGCDDILIYWPRYLNSEKEYLDKKINVLNNFISKSNKETYIYYIEKDTDVDFSSNTQMNLGEYLIDNLTTKNKHVYEVNNFDEFKRDFYKTDHHWNLDGSYRGYLELAQLLKISNPIKHGNKLCIPGSLSGSKASVSGAKYVYKEDFCAYDFELPGHEIFINGKKAKEYSKTSLDGLEGNLSYGDYYGWDYGEIIFDYKQPQKKNILIFGESYDNAIIELIASHYNKTYSIDLRNYERENGKNFNYSKYVKDKKIDKVIFVGNIDFFVMEEFNVEVE